ERYANTQTPPTPLPRSQKPATQYVPDELKYEELKKQVHLVVHVNRSENSGLGIRIAGGKGSTPYREDDDGIFITKILPSSPARNTGLKIGDKLIKVNQTNLSDLTHSQAVEALKEAVNLGQQIQLQVMQELDPNKLFFIKIAHDDEDSPVGFRINHNFSTYEQREVEVIHVTDQKRYCQLANGDIILQINGFNVDSMLEKDLQKYVLNSGKKDCDYEIRYLSVYRPYVEEADEKPSPDESQVENVCDYEIEEIRIMKQSGAMGLSIVGGGNVACHPFGVEKPGIFISKIVVDGAASKTKLKVGDRLLKVNGIDVTRMSHDDCVEELKKNAQQVVLLVSHDPQPSGMQEVVLNRSHPDETIGIRINGGIENKSANPYDSTDEGIFIVNIIPNTLAQNDGRLQVGTRIMEFPNVDLNNNEVKPVAETRLHLRPMCSRKKSIKRKRPSVQMSPKRKLVLMTDLNRLKNSFINSVYVDRYYFRFKKFYANFFCQNFAKLNHYNYLTKSNQKSYMKHFKRLFMSNQKKLISLKFPKPIMTSKPVNGHSLLGVKLCEAQSYLVKSSEQIYMVVCDGFNNIVPQNLLTPVAQPFPVHSPDMPESAYGDTPKMSDTILNGKPNGHICNYDNLRDMETEDAKTPDVSSRLVTPVLKLNTNSTPNSNSLNDKSLMNNIINKSQSDKSQSMFVNSNTPITVKNQNESVRSFRDKKQFFEACKSGSDISNKPQRKFSYLQDHEIQKLKQEEERKISLMSQDEILSMSRVDYNDDITKLKDYATFFSN
ncbi:scribble -like protein, partial [Brachionus plicatilis]